MASANYQKGSKKIYDADIDFLVDTIKAVLIDTGTYTFSQAHEFYSDLSGVVGTATALANKTTTSGTLDADDTVVSAVSGNSVEAVVLFKDTGVTTTSPLITYLEVGAVTPDGGDITIQWNASGIRSI